MFTTIAWALAIYFIVWWITLFVTLPFGVRSQHEEGGGVPGSDPGAPVMPHMRRKVMWTTVISLVVYSLGMWGYREGLLTVDRLARLMGF
jgi:predicted secreted protein